MVAYLDSSAIVKLVVREGESASLRKFLRTHPVRVVSALARVEVPRAVRAHGQDAIARAGEVLDRLVHVAVDNPILDRAATLDASVLRSLDAIHVATALQLGEDLAVLVTYDDRMRSAALAHGLRVEAPTA